VSTADHAHYPAAMHAIALGKHVCVQKPLTNTLWEAREEITRCGRGAVRVVQQIAEEADLIEKTVFVLRVFLLCELVLFERLFRLPEEPITISKIGPHIGSVGSRRDRFFANNMKPLDIAGVANVRPATELH